MGIHEVYGAVYRQLGFDAVENPISCQHPVWRASPTASEAASGDLRKISGAAEEGVGSTRNWRLHAGDATRALLPEPLTVLFLHDALLVH